MFVNSYGRIRNLLSCQTLIPVPGSSREHELANGKAADEQTRPGLDPQAPRPVSNSSNNDRSTPSGQWQQKLGGKSQRQPVDQSNRQGSFETDDSSLRSDEKDGSPVS